MQMARWKIPLKGSQWKLLAHSQWTSEHYCLLVWPSYTNHKTLNDFQVLIIHSTFTTQL